MLKKSIPYLAGISIALFVGGVSAYVTMDAMDLYADIVKPSLAPPALLFPIVWTVLYVLMGISSALIYNKKQDDKNNVLNALIVYFISLLINFAWSPVFFIKRSFLFALILLIGLWISVLITILKYKKIKTAAAYLQIPYLLWCSFATYLNASVYFLN